MAIDLPLHQLSNLLFVGGPFGGRLAVDCLHIGRELVNGVAVFAAVGDGFDFIEPFAMGGGFLFPSSKLSHLLRSACFAIFRPPDRGEERLKAVVVLLQYRIELMVMALCAADSQAHKNFARDTGHLVDDDVPLHMSIALIPLVDSMAKKGGRNVFFWIIGGDFVSGQLFTDKLIIGLVLI